MCLAPQVLRGCAGPCVVHGVALLNPQSQHRGSKAHPHGRQGQKGESLSSAPAPEEELGVQALGTIWVLGSWARAGIVCRDVASGCCAILHPCSLPCPFSASCEVSEPIMSIVA